MKKCFVFLFFVPFLSLLMFSQIRGGDIYGTVFLEHGSPALGVHVIATFENVKLDTFTDERGHFHFKTPLPGTYELTFQQERREPVFKRGIRVEPGHVTRVDMNMQTGEIRVEITTAGRLGDIVKGPHGIQPGSEKSYKDPKYHKKRHGNWNRLREIPYEKGIHLYRIEGNSYELDMTIIRRMLDEAEIKGPFTFEIRGEKESDGRNPFQVETGTEGQLALEMRNEKSSGGRNPFLFESPMQIPDRILLPDAMDPNWFRKPHQIIFKNEKGEVQATIPVSLVFDKIN